MGQRVVSNTHRWAKDNLCKGCDVALVDPKAQEPCPTPYRPRARLEKEKRKV